MHHPPDHPNDHPNAKPMAGDGGLPVVNMLRAKTHLSRLVHAVESGAVAEILIARHGHPVARLTSLKGPSTGLRFGLAKGPLMQLLLDTLSFLWLIRDDPRLGPRGRRLLQDADLVLLSAASLWQLAQQNAMGHPDALTASEALHWAEASGLQLLPIHTTHLLQLEQLPPQHPPADRLLLAQAITTPLTLVSPKHNLRGHGCWVVDPRH